MGLALCVAACTLGCSYSMSDRIRRSVTIPSRQKNSITGSEFLRRTADYSMPKRQTAALEEIQRGNIPDFLRTFGPVALPPKNGYQVTIWVMPDYLSIGSDRDFVRIPLALRPALAVAASFHCTLPTVKMVDAIYDQAKIKLAPRALPAADDMRSNIYTMRHHGLVQAQLANCPPGELVAGHKKDLVISQRLLARPDRQAIYGWHQPDGVPIQPLSTYHGAAYADYSHGVRLVSNLLMVNGSLTSMHEARRDPALMAVLTDEESLPDPESLF